MKGWELLLSLAVLAMATTLPTGEGFPFVDLSLKDSNEATGHSHKSRRHLSEDGCGVQIDSSTEQYTACRSLPQRSSQAPLEFLYSLSDNGDGTSTMQVAFDGPSDGWVGWGIPTKGGGMKGASAVIVQKNAGGQGATAATYLMADYDAANFKKDQGTLRVSNVRAGAGQGRLQTAFSLQMDGSTADLIKAPLPIIYASGPIDDSGNLLPHRGRGFSTSLDLSTAVAAPFNRTRTTGRQTRPSGPAGAPPDTGRRLLQAAAACPETVVMSGPTGDPIEKRYATCKVLEVGDGAFRALYSVVDNGNGTSTLNAAITMDTSGWIGFGQPGEAGGMLGGSALVAKPNATSETGAEITQYFLGGYSPAKVQPGGSLAVADLAAEKSPDALTATFTMLLEQPATAALPIIYAFGRVSDAGAILPHDTGNMYAGSLPLSGALVSSAGGQGTRASPLARLAALTGGASFTPAPAAGPEPPLDEADLMLDPEEGALSSAAAGPEWYDMGVEGQDTYDMEGEEPYGEYNGTQGPFLDIDAAAAAAPELALGQTAVAGLAAAPAGVNPAAEVAAAGSGALPPSAAISSAPLQAGAHLLLFGGQTLQYNQMESLDQDGTFHLYWSVGGQRRRSLLQQNVPRTPVDVALEVQGADGWGGFGLPREPGKMVGGSAIVVKACSSCPTGASADNYYLEGMNAAQVKAGEGDLNVVDIRAEATADGRLLCTFRLYLPYSGVDLDKPIPILAALGAVSPTGSLRFHNRFYSGGQLNFASGTAFRIRSRNLLPKVHGYIMVISWGILIPLGAMVAASLKRFDPLWFQIHRVVQSIAYLAAIVGMGIGLYMRDYLGTYEEYVHRVVGLVVMGLGLLQVMALLLRPSKEHRFAWLWSGYHQFVGVVAILLAFTNAILGMRNMSLYYGYFVGFSLIWLAILGFWMLGRCLSARHRKQTGARLDIQWQHAAANGMVDERQPELQMGSIRDRR